LFEGAHADGNDSNANALLSRAWLAVTTLFDLRDEAVTQAREGLNVQRAFGFIVQSEAYLTDAEVQPLLEVNKGILAPDGKSNFFARHQSAPMIQQKRKNSRRLLLNTGQHAVLTQLKRLLVELKFPESNDRHGEKEGQLKLRDIIALLFQSFRDFWRCW
jgi:hypothetical protein